DRGGVQPAGPAHRHAAQVARPVPLDAGHVGLHPGHVPRAAAFRPLPQASAFGEGGRVDGGRVRTHGGHPSARSNSSPWYRRSGVLRTGPIECRGYGSLVTNGMFRKVLVANRGEIAIRAFRAAYELGVSTVAVFPYEDRNALPRAKADESYQIGEPGHPVRAYLSVEEIIKAAKRAGADAIYPGYGFLSENPELAEACVREGITFVGPPAEVLHLTGNKARAVAAAREAGVAVLRSSEPSADVDALLAAADDIGFPLFVKAVAGGGGRGMRRVDEPQALREAVEAAMREAESAFGDATVFLE